ncbi:hypothetical protein [Uliginosibacterium sp. TH139]|uniref:hypothetical protein n=1 Tax=Uliginosibacterium sp. TH139 TaxID=2067453 RepID=UPI000C7B0833|nr:hypothetical protein [Uliginosibacterium sp. TH139]PLK49756.1 hypothetical protein C0V76_04870 [Uliginosibacterium sp. TH139]
MDLLLSVGWLEIQLPEIAVDPVLRDVFVVQLHAPAFYGAWCLVDGFKQVPGHFSQETDLIGFDWPSGALKRP